MPPSGDPTGTGRRDQLSGRRFLVVDDHATMIDVICEMLRHFGARDVDRADSADKALARFGPQAGVDCVICDFNMKPINGLQLLQVIRAGKRPWPAREQPFVLVTGHGEMDVVRAARALDVSAYVVKPVAPDIFIKAVERALDTPVPPRPAGYYEKVSLDGLKRFQ